MFWIHFLLLLVVIFIGIRYGGVAFGLLGGLGGAVLVFVFGILPPEARRSASCQLSLPWFRLRRLLRRQGGIFWSSMQRNYYAGPGLVLFLLGILGAIVLAFFSKVLLPKGVGMSVAIQFMMLSVGAVIHLWTNIKPKDIVHSSVFIAGMTAVITIFGIAWLSDTIIGYHKDYLVGMVSGMVDVFPWTFAIAMFIVSVFLKSQAAVLTIMMPLGFSLHILQDVLIGVLPSCYAYFFFPFYPSDLAAISFDRTGTTRIGKYIVNHSFILPGLAGVGTATVVGYFLSTLLSSS